MKEEFLHYLWKFKKFDLINLQTTNADPIVIINGGQYLQLAGPDFFNAQLIIAGQKWAGNIEIHLKSSDWYRHEHERDGMYDNVILHVVWQHDAEVFSCNNVPIPVLELRQYVPDEVVGEYRSLTTPKSWIYCENQLPSISGFVVQGWLERLFIERLERKALTIYDLLETTKGDWEATLFCLLAKSFGLNTNGQSFLQMAGSIPFSIFRKEMHDVQNLEALLFGRSGLLASDNQDVYAADLRARYKYLSNKYQLESIILETPQFFRLRPDNFPTIRLSQLAALYHARVQLFNDIISCDRIDQLYSILSVSASAYWLSHYVFEKSGKPRPKKVSKAFMDLLIINSIVPLRFAYSKSRGFDESETVLEITKSIRAEPNTIVSKFAQYGVTAQNAFESQGLLQLKNEFCARARCLECAFGIELLKN